MISLIWRLSVTTVPDLLGVELGTHQETMRTMLYTGNPGGPDFFPYRLFRITLSDGTVQKFLTSPLKVKGFDGEAVEVGVGEFYCQLSVRGRRPTTL